MTDRRITHVKKDPYYGTITHVAGVWGTRAKADAVRDIQSGASGYHVQWPEKRTEVHVVNAAPPYLRTDRDNTTRNNLEDLPAL